MQSVMSLSKNTFSNEAFSISGKLLCDMILDAVQGVLQPYILVLSDFSALVVFSQKELLVSQVKVEQLIKKLYNRFTMYQSFAPDMLIRKILKTMKRQGRFIRLLSQMKDTIKTMWQKP